MTAKVLELYPRRTTVLVMLCPDQRGKYTRNPTTIIIQTPSATITQWLCEHCGTYHTLRTEHR